MITLYINIAIVIGPTPPGTGVIFETFDITSSKSTSPQIFLDPSSLFIPTSITIAPSFTNYDVINFGFPIAETKISAFFVISFKFFVFE